MQALIHRAHRLRRLPTASSMARFTSHPFSGVELLDGGTGEELFRRGLPDDRKIWSAKALVDTEYHKLLVQVHASFLRAGSDYITCNNYGVTPGVGFNDHEIARLSEIAGRLGRQAIVEADAPYGKVCGSMPPLVESYRPDRIPEFDEGVRLYALIASAMNVHVDCFLGETLSTIEEAKMVLYALKDYEKPVMVSFTLNPDGSLRSKQAVTDAVVELLHYRDVEVPGVQLHAVLFNCSLPESVTKALRALHENSDVQESTNKHGVRIGAYANRLTAIADDWSLAGSSEPQAMRRDLTPADYLAHVHDWIDQGASIIGGCCGIGPEYIDLIDKDLRSQGRRG